MLKPYRGYAQIRKEIYEGRPLQLGPSRCEGRVSVDQQLQAWATREHDWRHLIRHDPAERTYELLHRDDDVEIYLIGWMPGHDTGFHDHDDSSAAITVLEGAITEERLALGGTVKRTLQQGDTVTIGREAIHRVRHTGQRPATTLHAYSPPCNGSAPTR